MRLPSLHALAVFTVATVGSGASLWACRDHDAGSTTSDAAVDAVADGEAEDAGVDALDAAMPPSLPFDAGIDGAACPGFTPDAALDPAAVSRGLALVAELACATCHQSVPPVALVLSGRDTTSVPDAAIYPSNLTPDLATGLGCWTDTQIATAILGGVDNQGNALCGMPLYATQGIDGGAAADMVSFLRSLGPVVNAVPASVCPAAADDAGEDAADEAGDEDASPDAPDDGAADASAD